MTDSLYEHVGGQEAMHRLVSCWYEAALVDPLLQPLFGPGHDTHVPHVAAFLAEVFGGPTRYTDELGGYPVMLESHRGTGITENQRRRFVELFLSCADEAGWPSDHRTRDALRSYLELGSRIAAQTSHRTVAEEPEPPRKVPRWLW